MAAPEGNQFWKLRSTHGRDKLFETPELLWEAACEYFEWCEDNPLLETEQAKGTPKPFYDEQTNQMVYAPNLIELPKMRAFTMQGLCLYLDCGTAYFRNFKNEERGKQEDFKSVINKIEEIIYNQKFTGAAAGFLNANIIARDLGLSEKQDNRFVDKEGNDVVIFQIPDNGRNNQAARGVSDEGTQQPG